MGRLYDVEQWIAAGKSIAAPPECKKTPLRIAIETGFHSMIELLLRHEVSQEAKDAALNDALLRKRLDLVRLILGYGANIRAIPFVDVLLTWEPSLIRFFLENGADTLTDSPFAVAFGEKVRTALRPFVEYKRSHPELTDQLQEQADRALRYFCSEGNLKWVNLMLWAGANPRTRGPKLHDPYGDNDPECYTTAMQEACYSGNVDVLKRLKPDPARDHLAELLSCASTIAREEAVRHLLEIGADPNDGANGGSAALNQCLSHLGFEDFQAWRNKRLSSKYGVRRTFGCIQALVEHGAQWRPDDKTSMDHARRSLYKCEPEVTVDLIKLFLKHKACSDETLRQFLKVPRMRQHLSGTRYA
jgi:hypothetical protein